MLCNICKTCYPLHYKCHKHFSPSLCMRLRMWKISSVPKAFPWWKSHSFTFFRQLLPKMGNGKHPLLENFTMSTINYKCCYCTPCAQLLCEWVFWGFVLIPNKYSNKPEPWILYIFFAKEMWVCEHSQGNACVYTNIRQLLVCRIVTRLNGKKTTTFHLFIYIYISVKVRFSLVYLDLLKWD